METKYKKDVLYAHRYRLGSAVALRNASRAVRIVLSPYPCLMDSIDRVNTQSLLIGLCNTYH